MYITLKKLAAGGLVGVVLAGTAVSITPASSAPLHRHSSDVYADAHAHRGFGWGRPLAAGYYVRRPIYDVWR